MGARVSFEFLSFWRLPGVSGGLFLYDDHAVAWY